MAIQSINNNYSQTQTTGSTAAAQKSSLEQTAKKEASSPAKEEGVVYEKSYERASAASNKTQTSAVIAQMKAESNNRLQQLQSIVHQMMTKQGAAIGTADSMWRFLAGGNFTVSAAAKAQAQKDIADDGYWGVNQTSDRIVDFAKALSGNDPDKADEMLAAIQKGFKLATKSWGRDLPDITNRTYKAIEEKIDAWKKEGSTTAETETGTEE